MRNYPSGRHHGKVRQSLGQHNMGRGENRFASQGGNYRRDIYRDNYEDDNKIDYRYNTGGNEDRYDRDRAFGGSWNNDDMADNAPSRNITYNGREDMDRSGRDTLLRNRGGWDDDDSNWDNFSQNARRDQGGRSMFGTNYDDRDNDYQGGRGIRHNRSRRDEGGYEDDSRRYGRSAAPRGNQGWVGDDPDIFEPRRQYRNQYDPL